ncbi:hypothetical protein KKB10_05165, partial [Patescibacteria group bacterium]|nr:hypothetical protein [Patescibacteria group bacterium]
MTLVEYTKIKIEENNEHLVNLNDYNFVVEPKYHNQGLSADPNLFLRKGVVKMLKDIQKELGGYRFKIWDAFRSRDVQNNIYQKFRRNLKDEHPDWNDDMLKLETGKFVSPPYEIERIPPHATGGAVDLTLTDSNGKELDMGTDFDFFGPAAGFDYFEKNDIDSRIRNNRVLLRNAMVKAGFRQDKDEWWHYDYGNQIWALELNKSFAFYGEA